MNDKIKVTPTDLFGKLKYYKKYKELFDNNIELINIKEEFKLILSQLKTPIGKYSELQEATARIILRSDKLFTSFMILCNEGYFEDAAILLRSLYENMISLKYIIKHSCPEKFLNWLPIAVHNRLTGEKDIIGKSDAEVLVKIEKALKENESRYNESVSYYRNTYKFKEGKVPQKWTGKDSMRALAVEAGVEVFFDYLYSYLCEFVHADIHGGRKLIKWKDDKNIEMSDLPIPPENDFRFILIISTILFAELLKEFAKIFDIDTSDRRYERLFAYSIRSENDGE
jgi:hypothetical protein